jgi:SNF2 family DNA or RNA helicase
MPMAQFKNTFCEYLKITKRHNGRTTQQEFIVKYHNVDYLYSIIEPYVFECDLQLTIEQQHHVLHFSLSDESREAYNRWKGEFLDAGKMEMLNNNIFLRMTQKMQHAYCCDAGKADALRELLAKHDPEKVIVYCKYVDSYKAVQQAFPMLQVLSYGKHAIGLNLQQYNVTVYWDKTFDYAQMVQSEFRTYRTGQQSDCLYYRLTGDVGLERLIDTNIDRKQTLLDYFKAVGNKIIDEL